MSEFELRRIERRHRAEIRRIKSETELVAACATVLGGLAALFGALLAL